MNHNSYKWYSVDINWNSSLHGLNLFKFLKATLIIVIIIIYSIWLDLCKYIRSITSLVDLFFSGAVNSKIQNITRYQLSWLFFYYIGIAIVNNQKVLENLIPIYWWIYNTLHFPRYNKPNKWKRCKKQIIIINFLKPNK